MTLILLLTSVAWSRFFLGAHTLNQLLFGILLGMWLTISLHFCLRNWIIEQVNGMTSGSEKNIQNKLLLVTSGLAIAVTFIFIRYGFLDRNMLHPIEWDRNF